MRRCEQLLATWRGWVDLFGVADQVPVPSSGRWTFRTIYTPDDLTRAFGAADTSCPRVTSLLRFFEAALGTIGTELDKEGDIDHETLTRRWRQACMPTTQTARTMYGPSTEQAYSLLRQSRDLSPDVLDQILVTRARLDPTEWDTATAAVTEASRTAGYPHRGAGLARLAQSAARLAGDQMPDPLLIQAIWGPAAVAVLGQYLDDTACATLMRPWSTAKLSSAS